MTSQPFSDPAATWNKRFETETFIFGREANEFLRSHASLLGSESRVLCVADGEGRNSVWLAQQGHRVDAFDVSAVGVAKAKKLASDSGVAVDYRVADCDRLIWPAEIYDVVVAIFVQFADPNVRKRLFANMVRTLKPGGLLILQGYTPKQLDYKTGGPPIASHLYSASLMRTSFPSLDSIELREYEQELAEGTQHRGRSALIGLVARKR